MRRSTCGAPESKRADLGDLRQGKKLSMFKPYMFGCPSKSWVFLICFVILDLAAQAQGPRSVPAPVPPPVKRAPTAKKVSCGLPPDHAFKDVAKEGVLTVACLPGPGNHYGVE